MALLAEELAHELCAPASFFDTWSAALARGDALSAEDLDIAREESQRLRALVAELRRVEAPPLLTHRVSLADLVTQALQACDADWSWRAIRVDALIPVSLVTDVDDGFEQDVLRPVFRAIAAGVMAGGRFEVRGQSSGGDAVLVLHGSPAAGRAVPERPPWAARTAEERALAVARRIVRAHGGRMLREDVEGAITLRLVLPVAESRSTS
jgi:signal transduction histidine kinase